MSFAEDARVELVRATSELSDLRAAVCALLSATTQKASGDALEKLKVLVR